MRMGVRLKRAGIWGYIYIHIADSLRYTPETNTTL